MKKLLLPIFMITSIIYSCKSKEKKEVSTNDKPVATVDSTLVTDSSWGLINKQTDYAALQKSYGANNVVNETICGPECADSIDVTKIYPGTPREIIVHWDENGYQKSISMLENYMEGAPYHTASGLKIGSTLADILKENGGKQIMFNGFDWDYGGYIVAYGGGPLEKSKIRYRLMHNDDFGEDLMGDEEFNTEMPEAKKRLDKILIGHLILGFGE